MSFLGFGSENEIKKIFDIAFVFEFNAIVINESIKFPFEYQQLYFS